MQKYNNMPKEQNNFKGIVLEFLDFLRYKIENDCMTMEDMEALATSSFTGFLLTQSLIGYIIGSNS